MNIAFDVAAVRRHIATAAGLVLLFALVIWLAPDRGPERTVFEAANRRPVAEPAGGAAPRSDEESGKRAAEASRPEKDQAAPGVAGKAPAATGDAAGEPLERLPPRPPLSAPELRADTPKPQLLARPIALDGARIAYRQGVVTLPGVEALPLNAQCGAGAAAFPCGVKARTELRRFLRGRSIACDVPADFGVRRSDAASACTVAGEDIGRWVVENGWAKATPDGPYGEAEATAKRQRRGIWETDTPAAATQ
ncbi:thermonuclease family protein [Jiella sonneratiae]|uniref:Thermonuclease family protein n=1 Tax=Jiella sonneratiae TaxID=2816856 RepID=A0ABS3J4Y9_9HYPH|nr:thermonuclease family protein [Jiella sonneratiae]MBO0904195.1 thermonuclease family protein [Jiella sonneratiae]